MSIFGIFLRARVVSLFQPEYPIFDLRQPLLFAPNYPQRSNWSDRRLRQTLSFENSRSPILGSSKLFLLIHRFITLAVLLTFFATVPLTRLQF